MTDHPLVPLVDETVYLVLNDYGDLGFAWVETNAAAADLETTISDLLGASTAGRRASSPSIRLRAGAKTFPRMSLARFRAGPPGKNVTRHYGGLSTVIYRFQKWSRDESSVSGRSVSRSHRVCGSERVRSELVPHACAFRAVKSGRLSTRYRRWVFSGCGHQGGPSAAA